MKDSKKKIVKIICSILIVLICLSGLSFAFLKTTIFGTNQIVKVGELDLILNETSEGISLNNAYGIDDNEISKITPSTFSLKNNGNKDVEYTIYLDDSEISNTETRMNDKYLKFNLVKNGTNLGIRSLNNIGNNPNRVLDSGIINANSTNSYSFKLFITNDVDGDYSNQVFKGKLRVIVRQTGGVNVATKLLTGVGSNGAIDTSDPEQTFITGTNPNNYIWYSGKLWRAVSIDPSDNYVKLITQSNISAVSYNAVNGSEYSSVFENSYIEDWLNATSSTGYLNNGLRWWLLTPGSLTTIYCGDRNGNTAVKSSVATNGVRPVINLKANVKITRGSGTENDPYRLKGDDDTVVTGTNLNTRYSGEYVRFGTGDNNLYRIVSHESENKTKIVSAVPLLENDEYKKVAFDTGGTNLYSNTTTIGAFLNGSYLTDYISSSERNMIDNTVWYIGLVDTYDSHKLAKYMAGSDRLLTSTTTTKVGLLRYGELMAGQFNSDLLHYWILSQHHSSDKRPGVIVQNGVAKVSSNPSTTRGVRPALNLKATVKITSGTGTKTDPFIITN